MRTEVQLRDALQTLAERAPAGDGLAGRFWPPARVSDPRPRRGAVVVAVALTLTLVVLAAAGALQFRPRPVPAPGDRRTAGHWAMVSELVPPADWTIGRREIAGAYETTVVSDSTGKGVCRAEVNGRGFTPHTQVPTATTPVTVGDRPGRYATPSAYEAGVYWTYAEEAEASVVCSLRPNGLGSATTLAAIQALVVQLAERVRFGDFPLLVPIRFQRLPAGYTVGSASQDMGNPERWLVSLAPSQATPTTPTVGIAVAGDGDIPAPNTRVGGYPATTVTDAVHGPYTRVPRKEVTVTSLYLRTTPVPIRLSAANTAADDPDQRVELLRGIAAEIGYAASPIDTSTWFTARDALAV